MNIGQLLTLCLFYWSAKTVKELYEEQQKKAKGDKMIQSNKLYTSLCIKVSGPCDETACDFFCIYEMLVWKNDYN